MVAQGLMDEMHLPPLLKLSSTASETHSQEARVTLVPVAHFSFSP